MARQRAHSKRHTGPEVVLMRQQTAPTVAAVYRPAKRAGFSPYVIVRECPFCACRHVHSVAPGERELSTSPKCDPMKMYRLSIATG
jgi:hypothetical protein